MTRDLHDLWTIVRTRRDDPRAVDPLPDLHRLTPEDLHDDAVRAAVVVALHGLGTDRLTALLDLRDDLASGVADTWADAWAQEAV
ncbi:hypothetical protein [Kineococcus rhizosphaerae]|uniref:Uncharacterized protein n=1 Tax=Kineococcus rhizosphaerae TaxID=559628 RepID=A0A2T0QX52_9ACTN|nr:hypothetical protein [Kineococcus rhizosphaerae]PRY10473.1 hypothetical protein CLV37_11626 [Kineococcus rhizosphaerae]